MNKDEITDIVKMDDLIKMYGAFVLAGKGCKKASDISQRLRLLGRLLQSLRGKVAPAKKNDTLSDFLCPEYFDRVIECVKEMAGYSLVNSDGERLPSFKTPSLPLKMGYALDSVLMLQQGWCFYVRLFLFF